MTSQERVLATLEGKTTDRVASDFRAEPEVFETLRRHLRLPDAEAVRRWAKSDIRDLGVCFSTGGYGGYNSFGWTDRDLGGGVREDFWGVRRQLVRYDGGAYIDIVSSPLQGVSGMDALRRYRFPDPREIFDFSGLPAAVKSLHVGDRYFTMIEGESLHDRCWAMRGFEDFMVDMMVDEEAAWHLIDHNFQFFCEYTRMILEKAEGLVDAIGIFNDLGNQQSMMISPQLYRKYFKERQRDYIRMAKGFGVKVFYHSCGHVTEILPDLVEIGADIIDPLQFNALGVSPAQLRALCPGVTLHGGLDTQGLLVRGSPGEVREAARKLKRELGAQGRYVLSCSHLLQVDVPLENIEAIVAEVN